MKKADEKESRRRTRRRGGLGVLGWSLLLLAVVSCTSKEVKHAQPPDRWLEEIRLPLRVGQPQTIVVRKEGGQVVRFDIEIPREGLYRFETEGTEDALCAVVGEKKHGEKEPNLIVKGGEGRGSRCRFLWAFGAGPQTIKVRADAKGPWKARIEAEGWEATKELALGAEQSHEGQIKNERSRHRFSFVLPESRMVLLKAEASGRFQCILKKADATWLASPPWAGKDGLCEIGRWLSAGRYVFELRPEQIQADYKVRLSYVRLVELESGQIREGWLSSGIFDLYRLQIQADRRILFQTHGTMGLSCQLEAAFGQVVGRSSDKRKNCLLAGQYPAGVYLLRVQTTHHVQPGAYQVSFRQETYEDLESRTDREITPAFHASSQLFRIALDKPRLLQIATTGRALRCTLHRSRKEDLSVMDLSEGSNCLLFANLEPAAYFLQITPLERQEGPYRLRVTEYVPPNDNRLDDRAPRLLGPVSKGFRQTFVFEVAKPQLAILETRGGLDTYCELFDPQGVKIADDDDSGEKNNCKMTRYLPKGKYRLAIRVSGRVEGLFWVQRKEQVLPLLHAESPRPSFLRDPKKPQIFLFQVKKEGVYLLQTEGQLDTVCVLYNQEWQKLATDDDSGQEKNCSITRVLKPGVYPFHVSIYRNPGPFKASASLVPLLPLPFAQKFEHRLQTPQYSQLFQIHVTKREVYQLRTFGTLDTICSLLDAAGIEIAKNDDASRKDKNCLLTESLSPGVYYFRVHLYVLARLLGPATYQVGWFERGTHP